MLLRIELERSNIMPLSFFNTMTRKREVFQPIEDAKVRMYTCGPTVYNFAHIGNLRAYIFEDQLRRYLQFKGYTVEQVMNLTDVDDKIIRRCKELNIPLLEYTEPFKNAFFDSLMRLNIQDAEHYPEASAHISDMEEMIETLLKKGLAYRASDGNIFFKIAAFPAYGKLQNLDLSAMRSGERVSDDEYEKESVHDFALWKAWKEEDGEIFWDSPLGKGRPGWHIECSAMSTRYLGKTFDIHTGGVDNIFPHHENEIAQSEGAFGQKFVNYWLHCEHLTWDNEKMSKSLGNIIYLDTLVEKGYSERVVRYALLSTHYRQKLNFTMDLLANAEKALVRVDDFLFELKKHQDGEQASTVTDACRQFLEEFETAMDDDLNISRALASLFDLIRTVNTYRREKDLSEADVDLIHSALRKADSVLGVIFFPEKKSSAVDEDWINEQIAERNKARAAKNWTEADRIRDLLKEKGVELLDRKDGTDYKVL